MMDARKDRIGEHAAEHALPWAVTALGPVPDHPAARLDWQRRGAPLGAPGGAGGPKKTPPPRLPRTPRARRRGPAPSGAGRERPAHNDPADPVGPEPAGAAPDLRAAWHEAFAALTPVDGPDVRGLPDGRLLHLRDTYPIETAWAPQWVGDELRQVRAAAWHARLAGLRATRRGPRRPPSRPPRPRRPAGQPGRQLPGPARHLPPARNPLRRYH